MDEENFPVQCHPITIPNKKKYGDIKNETV